MVILTGTWEATASETIPPRGKPLPRHAIPSDIPSYYNVNGPGEVIAGSMILPVAHWQGQDASGALLDERYTQYAPVIVSENSLNKLAAAGILPHEEKIYTSLHECAEAARTLNQAEHESYLGKYSRGELAHIRDWQETEGSALRVRDVCLPQPSASEKKI